MTWILFHGDVRDKLAEVKTGTLQTCVTSPPYWGLRDYKIPPSIWGGNPDCEHEWGDARFVPCGNAPSGKTTLRGGRGRVREGEKYHHSNASVTSQGNFCRRCGAPWERITERRAFHKKGWGEAKKDHMEGVSGPQSMIREGHGRAGEVKVRTLGWKPTCECEGNTGAGRCVVLDPFAGTGTTLYESELLGRDSIGIEISEKYCELIHERMGRFRMSLF